MNKFLNNLKNWWNKWYKYVIMMIVVMLLIIIFYFLAKKSDMPIKENIDSQQIYIFNTIEVQNLLAWITIITAPYAAGWAIYQYKKSILLRQQEESAKIAKLFSDELLLKCDIVNRVILSSKLKELYNLNKVDLNNLQRFDQSEIVEIYSQYEDDFYKKYDAIMNDDLIQTTYLNYLEFRISNNNDIMNIMYKDNATLEKDMIKNMSEKYSDKEITDLKNKNLLEDEFNKFYLSNGHDKDDLEKFKRKKYTDKDARDLFILDNKDLPFKFKTLMSSVLNELEYICMYISSQSAGTNFLYQSLHQIFLKTIKNLAPTIAHNNKNYSDKYYTNIIHVYKEWQKINKTKLNDERKNKKKADDLMNPPIDTV